MIETVLKIFSGIIVLEFLRAWMKCLLDEGMLLEEYKYCRNCDEGFCTADPKCKGCKKWEREHREN